MYKDPQRNTKSKWITLAPIEYGVFRKYFEFLSEQRGMEDQ